MIGMTRQQRHQSEVNSAVRAAVDRFVESPCRLSAQQVQAILDELCVDLGICLQDYETVANDPPTNPQAFAELVMRLEGVGPGDPEIFLPVLRRVLCTFERAARRQRSCCHGPWQPLRRRT